jgi:flagellar basal body P-ring formation protein FlgA
MSRFGSLVWTGLLAAGLALSEPCVPVEHDPIVASDLAPLLPAFGKLPAATPVAAAPGPGVRRVFRVLELQSFARSHSLDLPAAKDVCFEWPMEVPDRARLLEAMAAALPFPETHIEILETSRYPAPRGRIEFRREDLGAPALLDAPAPVVWRGNVVYNGSQRFAVWARVRVTARVPRLVAVELIRRGRPVLASQIRVESNTGFPGTTDLAATVDQVEGLVALRNIPAGAEIHLRQLEPPLDIHHGDMVEVEVRSGLARVATTGKAEADGRSGDLINIRNLRSNRLFSARITGKDKAVVDTGSATIGAMPQGD